MPFWLNHGISGEITWPSCEVEFLFGKHRIVALPTTLKSHASLHIDLEVHSINHVTGMSVLSQILSLASWIEDAPAKLLPGWAGNPAPVPVPRHPASSPSSRFDF